MSVSVTGMFSCRLQYLSGNKKVWHRVKGSHCVLGAFLKGEICWVQGSRCSQTPHRRRAEIEGFKAPSPPAQPSWCLGCCLTGSRLGMWLCAGVCGCSPSSRVSPAELGTPLFLLCYFFLSFSFFPFPFLPFLSLFLFIYLFFDAVWWGTQVDYRPSVSRWRLGREWQRQSLTSGEESDPRWRGWWGSGPRCWEICSCREENKVKFWTVTVHKSEPQMIRLRYKNLELMRLNVGPNLWHKKHISSCTLKPKPWGEKLISSWSRGQEKIFALYETDERWVRRIFNEFLKTSRKKAVMKKWIKIMNWKFIDGKAQIIASIWRSRQMKIQRYRHTPIGLVKIRDQTILVLAIVLLELRRKFTHTPLH